MSPAISVATGNSPGTHGNWIYLMHPITGLSTLGMSVGVKPKHKRLHKDPDGFTPGSVPRAAQGWPQSSPIPSPSCPGAFLPAVFRECGCTASALLVSPVCGTLLKSCQTVMCRGQVSQGAWGWDQSSPDFLHPQAWQWYRSRDQVRPVISCIILRARKKLKPFLCSDAAQR